LKYGKELAVNIVIGDYAESHFSDRTKIYKQKEENEEGNFVKNKILTFILRYYPDRMTAFAERRYRKAQLP
jgi:hypothetical protein